MKLLQYFLLLWIWAFDGEVECLVDLKTLSRIHSIYARHSSVSSLSCSLPANDNSKSQLLNLKERLQHTSICFIGLMGSGKSTVGKVLANKLNMPHYDIDREAENLMDVSISTCFGDGREEEFRSVETRILKDLCARRGIIISSGGGVVLKPENWKYMSSITTVFLDLDPVHIFDRMKTNLNNILKRPLLHSDDPLSKLKALSIARRPLYLRANVTVPLDPVLSLSSTVYHIIDSLGKYFDDFDGQGH